ncbi:MAG: GGDEF domain-containing protein [Mariprofundaceae bacterium]
MPFSQDLTVMINDTQPDAAVSLDQHDVHLLLIGAGQGGLAMLELLHHYRSWLHIDCMTDIDSSAPGIRLARSLNIPTSNHTESSISEFEGNIIVDMTGNPRVNQTIKQYKKHTRIEIISANSARLVFDLVCRQRDQKNQIQTQNLRLNMLSSMLDISLKLEQHKDTADVLQNAIEGIHTSLLARKSLAIILDNDNYQSFGILDIEAPSYMPKPFCKMLQQRFLDFDNRDTNNQYFEYLDPAIDINDIEGTFNLAIPLLQDHKLLAMILIQSSSKLNQASRTMLSMTASHLRLAIKALDSHQKLEAQATRDPLTQSFNRNYFDKRLNQEVARIKRLPHGQLSCMFFDLDDFKSVNDNYGHQAGDDVLKAVATTIESTLRSYDTCARFGGDEFIALLPFDELQTDITACDISQRILNNIKAIQLPCFPEIKISVSIGLATLSSSELQSPKHLLKLADQAVYIAKNHGKGCVHKLTAET